MLLSMKKENLDSYKHYDKLIKIPKYKNELTLDEKKLLLELRKTEIYEKILKEANEPDTIAYYKNTELADIDVDIIEDLEPPKPNPREGWDEQFKKAKESDLDNEEANDF